MSAEAYLRPKRGLASPLTGVIPEEVRQTWFYKFLLFPVGQMIIFIVGASAVLTLLAYLVALLVPEPRPGIVLADQISRQLPGMIISGITIGFVYSMVALGYTLVYGVLKFINFAHSEIFMVGAVTGYEIMLRIQEAGLLQQMSPFMLVPTLVIGSGLLAGLLAVLIERVAYRPLRGAPRLVPLITAIGLSFVLQDVVRAFFSLTRNAFNLTYPLNNLEWLRAPVRLTFGEANVNVRVTSILIVVSAVIMLVALNYFVNGTKWGRAIRATSQDQTMAGLLGINVNLMISLTFFLGGSLGGASGALYGLNIGTVTPYVGFIPGLKAFTAAVLGGIGNLTGALLGGLTLGIIESFLNGILVYFPALGTRYTDIFTFSILILILIFRPSGLLGEKVDEKV
ncbi:MAG: branched-chain amino acid ABC transporter permease [Anaerolineae bacterium]|nr:branched-chain amino acid ABC transporter permease [Anaerolineae bacterium]MDW8172023.1 branched-chain amino acid ABC transporter permease [Anaerolineae bacterium]